MNRRQAIEALVAARRGGPVITGPGASSGTLYATRHEPATIYNMELGYAAAMCLGVALAAPAEWVVAVEGDGSLVAGLPVLATIGRHRPPNLTLLVLDNGVYGTGSGDEPTATTCGTDLVAVARACGIPSDRVVAVAESGLLRDVLDRARQEPGPWVVVASIDRSDARPGPERPRPGVDIVESGIAFYRAMRGRAAG